MDMIFKILQPPLIHLHMVLWLLQTLQTQKEIRLEIKYYNGRPTIANKVELAVQKLSGIMIWELGQDSFTEYSLLETIHKT